MCTKRCLHFRDIDRFDAGSDARRCVRVGTRLHALIVEALSRIGLPDLTQQVAGLHHSQVVDGGFRAVQRQTFTSLRPPPRPFQSRTSTCNATAETGFGNTTVVHSGYARIATLER